MISHYEDLLFHVTKTLLLSPSLHTHGQTKFPLLPMLLTSLTLYHHPTAQMNIVEAEEMCPEKPVRLCTIQADELSKCTDLQAVLKLRGVSPPLQCVMGTTLNDCLNLITRNKADIMTLTDKQRFNKQQYVTFCIMSCMMNTLFSVFDYSFDIYCIVVVLCTFIIKNILVF